MCVTAPTAQISPSTHLVNCSNDAVCGAPEASLAETVSPRVVFAATTPTGFRAFG
jgi:hypothetical protein